MAILGLKQSGKSTLFQIMTGVNSREIYGEPVVRGISKIPDDRFNRLVEIFKPVKVTPAIIPFVDVTVSGEKGWESIRQTISGVDGIIHIVDCFTTDDVPEMIKRYKTLEEELILSDLIIVERRIEKLTKLPANALRLEEQRQLKIMPRLKTQLEEGKSLRDLDLSIEEKEVIKNFTFWSIRPELVVLNVQDGMRDPVGEFQSCTKSPTLTICCQVEGEIAELPEEDRGEFLASQGIETPAFESIIRQAFAELTRIYYFTVGEDEVRAWVIRKDSTAPRAAAAIHEDFERGFIKAEVVSYDDFMASGESLAGAKSEGKLRLEGKEYIVQDGDIISFRFNV